GFRGTVILMHSAKKTPRLDSGLIYAEAGVASAKVARFAAAQHLEGAEFLAGIPGTVGGALAMNAGCYGGETWEIVRKVLTVNRLGELRERQKSEYQIGYRHCVGPAHEWFVGAWVSLKHGEGKASAAGRKEVLHRGLS